MGDHKRNGTGNFLDALLSIPAIYGCTISKDAKYVAYTWKNVHPNRDVFIIPIDGRSQPTALTETPESTYLASIAPDSKSVIVGEDKSKNERVRLFEVEIDKPKQMKPLTDEDPQYFLRGGSLHPNRKWLIYSANYNAEKKQEIEATWLYRHDLETQERTILSKPMKPAWVYPQLNSRGTSVLYNRKDIHPKGDQYWLVDLEGKDDREILNFGSKARIQAVWLPDGEKIGFITDTRDGEAKKHYSLGIYDVSQDVSQWIIDDANRNIERISSPASGNHLIVMEYQKARLRSSIIDVATMEEVFLPEIKGSVIPIGSKGANQWVGLYYSSTQPGDVVLFPIEDFGEEKLQSLTHVWERTTMNPEDLAVAQDFDWSSRDSLKIHGWLYIPKLPSKKTIIYVHGGPTAHIEDSVNPQIQYYVSQGFNVLAPNYRGSTGYGVEFEDSIRVNGWGSDEQEDIWEGARALIDREIAEGGKIGVTGTSYGGYSSWYAVTKAPQLFAAAVPICGMTDLVVDYETTRPDLRPYSEEMLGGSPTEVPERYYERSPINFANNISARLLIVQGARDPNVTPKNMEVVKRELDDNRIKYDLLVFDDEGHGISKTKNQKILFKKIVDFFQQALT
ncbi:MAG: prolyl oligopeptidase family serine peptidase [Candidatus Bathyarchaeota archaeon]|nr:prolyl oligopeptidase family serine peptidase [Candidatus Bathyarchaeota archaeon]